MSSYRERVEQLSPREVASLAALHQLCHLIDYEVNVRMDAAADARRQVVELIPESAERYEQYALVMRDLAGYFDALFWRLLDEERGSKPEPPL